MRSKFFALTAITVLMLNVAVFAGPDTRTKTPKQLKTGRLVSILPASDGIVVFDSKRFLDEALPKVLSSNQPMLGEVMAKVSEMESQTGIDLRKFEQVAVGVAFKQVSGKETDYEPVAIASGDINAGALVAVAKLASKGKYRTEMIGERTVYIFSAKDLTKKAPAAASNTKVAGIVDSALQSMTKDIAVAALDRNTLVLGSVSRVMETLAGKSRVSADLVAMLSAKDTAVMSFAAKTQGGMSKLLPLDNDEFGANIDSIQSISGSMEVGVAGASVQMHARTTKPEQAQALRETIDGLIMVGSAVFGNAKRPDQQVYGRMIKSAKVEQRGNEISFDLIVPQTDIDILIGGIK